MISLPSIEYEQLIKQIQVKYASGLPFKTLVSVIQALTLFRQEAATGKVIIHTGINKEGYRVYAVEIRRTISKSIGEGGEI